MSKANQSTRRNRGHRVQDVIAELRSYVVGWLNYYKLSCTYTVIEELVKWVRRRVRLYYWKPA
ncbi:group II intron maturase-specific domain-containing protein [Haloferula chungangensis]|uniref:Group II intron maturase-specific domain-containing protein n=1 Tax=Haloferula chungangensis TaxID=1048331 RepID=A0ABW2L9E0_9BACT